MPLCPPNSPSTRGNGAGKFRRWLVTWAPRPKKWSISDHGTTELPHPVSRTLALEGLVRYIIIGKVYHQPTGVTVPKRKSEPRPGLLDPLCIFRIMKRGIVDGSKGINVDYRFQINLRGIIDLLSNHLYSGPEVFVRELLQNGVDAIRARVQLEATHRGEIALEVLGGHGGKPKTVVFADNGVGLTEAEIHQFLATIGESSKRGDAGIFERPVDFIGQFGIGLLSCFVVSEEIVLITRSARGPQPGWEWRGRPDGTYVLKQLTRDFPPGTQVFLTCKPGCEELFTPDKISELARHYGGLLPYPIVLQTAEGGRQINADGAPWRRRDLDPNSRHQELMDYGRQIFEMDFLDAIPLATGVGEIDGVAYVYPFSPSLAHKRTHRVYLKNMLLSENADNLLPEWAFFVKCIVNANDLRPTASRESFYEDEKLSAARDRLGIVLRDYLVQLAKREPRRLERLIHLHFLTIKALACQDDEFYQIFIHYLPFETSLGRMTLREYRERFGNLQFVRDLDQFRQISSVAAAQGQAIINGGYVYDSELLDRYGEFFPDVSVDSVDPNTLTQTFAELTLEENDAAHDFLRLADIVLRPFNAQSDMKKFLPEELPALYATTGEGRFQRDIKKTREIADSLWGGILDNMASETRAKDSTLCFNLRNSLVARLMRMEDKTLVRRGIEMLYAHALLLGHFPLSSKEMGLLTNGMLGIIEWAVDQGAKP